MNTRDLNGREIDQLWWPDTEDKKGQVLKSTPCMRLRMSATHHGDHDQFWICEDHWNDGLERWEEMARHNPRYVDGWIWKENVPL